MEILPQLIVNALITGSIYALASSGLSLTYGLLKVLNFAHGHIMMLGGYVFFGFYVLAEQNLLVSSLASIVVVACLGVFFLYVFVLPFIRYSFVLSFVTTLALATMLESTISMVFGVNVKSLSRGMFFESWELWGVYITPIQVLIIVSAIVLLVLLAAVLHLTPMGRRVRALKEHRHGAQSLGVSRPRVYLTGFTIGCLLAAYAGVLVGFETNIQPTMGNTYTIKAFAAMTLGGLGNIWGTIAGAFILGLVENLAIGLDFGGYSIPAGYKDAFAFTIILLVLFCKPEGLFGKSTRKA